MMEDKYKTYTMITLGVFLLASLGFNVMPEPSHYCDSRELQSHCFSLSSTEKTCYTQPTKSIGGKRCTEGWQEIPQDVFSCGEKEFIIMAYTDNGKYVCDGVGDDANCVSGDLSQTKLNELR